MLQPAGIPRPRAGNRRRPADRASRPRRPVDRVQILRRRRYRRARKVMTRIAEIRSEDAAVAHETWCR